MFTDKTRMECTTSMRYGTRSSWNEQFNKDIRTLGTFKKWHRLNKQAYGYQCDSIFNVRQSDNWVEFTGSYYRGGLLNEYRWLCVPTN